MGLQGAPARSTLSDALDLRDWRIHGPRPPRHALAMHLIVRARELYATEPLGIDLDATVYALDATTIDLCLSLFDWAPFRSTKAAVKLHCRWVCAVLFLNSSTWPEATPLGLPRPVQIATDWRVLRDTSQAPHGVA